MSVNVCSCVSVAIEQHSGKFDGLIFGSLVTLVTFPECWTSRFFVLFFDIVFVQVLFVVLSFQSVLLLERKAFAVRLKPSFWLVNFDFVEWKYLLLFLVALSLCLCLCVCSVSWCTVAEFTVCSRLN